MATPTDAAVAPTITSDLPDYAPGGTVTLTGAGWQPGEDVTIVVNDTGGLSWSLNQKVVADAEGRLTSSFALPAHYVADYTVTATGAVSGTATTTFTDAPLLYNYWMQESVPAGSIPVTRATQITYNVYGQRTGSTAVTARITLTLTGPATFDDSGQVSNVTVTNAGKTATWTLTGQFPLTTVGVKATVASAAPAGPITATVNGDGTLVTSTGTKFSARTHTVTDPVTRTCNFADEASGAYASSICWFDLDGYNPAIAVNGQTMRQTLPDDYTLTYTIKVGSSDAAAAAKAFPTWTGSYLGNPNSGVGGYQGITGMPAIYQSAAGTTTLALSNIGLTDRFGATVSGFALVGADAESTDDKESISWTSSAPFTSIGPLGNACGGGFTGTGTTVNCIGGIGVGSKDGAAIFYSKDPKTFTQSMVGSGLQGVAFGVMVSGLKLNKKLVNKLPGDQFSISVARADKTVAATAITDLATGSAKTKTVYAISAGASQKFTLSEAAVGSALAENYATTWACNTNGEFTSGTGPSTTATVDLSDIVECTFTNTAPSLTLKTIVDNSGGGTLKPDAWILTAKSGSTTVIASPPSATTGLTATVPVPPGTYTLGESSTGTGANRYASSAWSCTNASGGPSTATAVPAAGDNVTCTITNTYVPTVIVRNTWVNGVRNDKAELTISKGTTTLGQAISTSNGNSGPVLDTINVASATPVVGDLVTVTTVTESMIPLNSGTYTTTLVSCVKGLNVPVGSGGKFTMPNSDVTCDFSTRPTAGTVTWSKVDAGSPSTLLKGSEWTLTGPNYPPAGLAITDCSVAPCAGPDLDPVAGQFKVAVLCGTCTLVEKTAPIGFQVGGTRSVIVADGQLLPLGAIANKRAAVPALPLTGGASTDAFLLVGYALIAAAGFTARRHRRRLLRL